MNIKNGFAMSAVSVSLLLAGCGGSSGGGSDEAPEPTLERSAVVTTNADIAFAAYSDSVATAQALKTALEALLADPTAATLTAAKEAWLAAREPYGQTEVYRFRVGPIDALKEDGTLGEEGDGPEGRINAWPLGEALIDYVAVQVDGDEGPEDPANALSNNIISDSTTYPTIDMDLLKTAFEFGGDERNVSSGYHAVEFLLWGQDLNQDQTPGFPRDASAGQRPVSDFYTEANGNINGCTSGAAAPAADAICTRRGQYLMAAIDLLIEDLEAVTAAWNPQGGSHYTSFIAGGDASLAKMLEGMGRMSYGELAGERINVALRTDSQEDEHSCFSDNTHRDIYTNAQGIQNTFLGQYTRVDGSVVGSGSGIYDLLKAEGEDTVADNLKTALETTMAAAQVLDDKAGAGMPFDTLIQEGINQPDVVAVIAGLVAQTQQIENAIEALNVTTNDLRQDTEEDI